MLKFNAKITHGIVIVSFLLLSNGCLYYDYGVDKATTKLPYRTYYNSEKDKKYDFTTVLYSTEEKPRGTYNYIDFNVSISHMYKESRGTHKGRYISKIMFSEFTTDDDIQIIPESIKLVHKNLNGDVIGSESIDHDLAKQPNSKHRRHYYKIIYNPEVLLDELNEYIYLEVAVNGILKKIEYNLPIKKALHYTFWDVLMGI